MSGSKAVINAAAMGQVRQALGAGLLSAANRVHNRAVALTPVHGDPNQGGAFATFAPGEKPIGGTLRRSLHTAAFVDGQPVSTSATTDGNGKPVPAYDGTGIVAYCGTNVDYAAFVHDGTVNMRARPFLVRAMTESIPEIPSLVAAGAKRYLARVR